MGVGVAIDAGLELEDLLGEDEFLLLGFFFRQCWGHLDGNGVHMAIRPAKSDPEDLVELRECKSRREVEGHFDDE